ncbi:MAG TPA: rhamnogalacturonan acetylesterase [Chthoniobacteraceae bacterium]|nr:rhamnogalacturonan acetylesterase [Chthoniobacteraceae bacterium]
MPYFLFSLLLFLASPVRAAPLHLAVVGDSTVADYKVERTAMRGWGQLLPEFLAPGVTVLNVAQSGRSTSTFPQERWQQVLKARPDFVLIQFGHNDSHAADRPEATDAATTFPANLRRYVAQAREAGIRPVLVTPPCRRTFDKTGHLKDHLAPYAEAMKAVAGETDIPVVDLHEQSRLLFEKLGKEGSTPFTMNESDRKGKSGYDLTHFTETGAREMARMVAEGLRGADPALADAVRLPGS